jgi:hypothetical protein
MGNVYNLCRVQNCYNTVLMVMSGMDPHMIICNLRWVWFGWFVEVDLIRLWVGHGVTP